MSGMQRRDFLELGTQLSLACAVARRARAERPSFAAGFDNEPRRALSAPFLDAHAHSSSPALLAFYAANGVSMGSSPVDGAEIIRRMNADGIQRAFVLSTAYQMAVDARLTRTPEDAEHLRVRLENDFTAAECARFADRLIPFLSVNPKRGYAVDEIDRCVDVNKMRGLKLHLWNSLVDTRQAADLAALKRVVARAAQRGLPVVAHILVGDVPNYGPDDTERFVREVIAPLDTLKISLAHLGGAGAFGAQQQSCFERLIRLCGPESEFANRVWVDMAAILLPTTPRDDAQRLGELLPRWGLHRVFWGSDASVDALAETRRQWPISDADWRTIAEQRGTAFLT